MDKTIEGLLEIANILNLSIPNGTEESFEDEDDDVKIILGKDDDCLKIEISTIPKEAEFDETKELVEEYKEAIKNLDDDLFLEIVEELKSKVDLTEFNELLNLEEYNSDEAKEVEEMINISSEIICSTLKKKIQNMVELYEKF